MTATGPEKRRDKRLELTLPVKFFLGPEKKLTPCEGVTHNVSSGGAYFEAPAFECADPLSLRIGIPAHQDSDKPNLTLVGEGAVRRIDKLQPHQFHSSWAEHQLTPGIVGVAVQFQQRPTVELRSLDGLLWEDRDR